jgi:TrpR-related protein YerC/YecD
MEKNIFNKKTNNLFRAILSLNSVNEAQKFCRDLCTIEEIKDMSERFEIARLIGAGMTYRDIAVSLKISTTTVSRVANWLNNGTGGYQIVLNNLHHHKNPSGER